MGRKKPSFKDTEAILAEFQDYAYRVSHDFNAPIRAIVEFSKILSQDYADKLDAEAKEYLSMMVDNGKKMQAMLEGLLQYSRLNTLKKDLAPVDLGRVVQHVQYVMTDSVKQSGTTLTIDELPTVYADNEQMVLLFTALIDNAIKFQPVGHTPHIQISAKKAKNTWRLAISDNGIGIQQQFQDKIFKLFGRLHPDHEYPGVGVGLTLAQKIVERHGGTIEFESTLGHGSIFYITLPFLTTR